jgi:type II secretory ATPase GspE/PulE/Tfp pilus assembly ATPase PilB-like protein
MIIKGASADDIVAYARKEQGMKLLFDDVVDKMCEGQTTLAEVYRISSEEE